MTRGKSRRAGPALALLLCPVNLAAQVADSSEPQENAGPEAATEDSSVAANGARSTAPNEARSAAASKADASPTDIVVRGNFYDSGAKSAMKMDLPVLDTPFAVNSYSTAFIDSLETSNLADLYNYMTGVKKAGNTAYDMTMRGFRSTGDDRNAIMVDGMPGLTGRFGSPPTIGIERIEVVKGPMSVLYGAIQPGGFVNMISRKPKRSTAYEFEGRGTSFARNDLALFDRNGYNVAADATGPIDTEGRLLYRIVGEHSDKDGFRDFTFDRGNYIAPSLTWSLNDSTELTGLFEYRKTRTSLDQGLVIPNSDFDLAPAITTRYQEPKDFRTETGKAATLLFSRALGSTWGWNLNYRHVDYDSDQKEYSTVAVVRRTSGFKVTRRARHLVTGRKYDYVDSNLTGEFTTGPISHKLLVGLNLGRDVIQENRLKFINQSSPNVAGVCPNSFCFEIDAYDPVYGRVPSVDDLPMTNPFLANQVQLLTNRKQTSTAFGAYISDLVTITDQLKLLVGARTFKEKQRIEELRVANVPEQEKMAKKTLLPSGGILFQPSETITLYGSYAESFVPADPGAQDINGLNPFEPIKARQYEVGVKTDKLLDGRVTATLSLFDIIQDGILNRFLCARGACAEQVGTARSRGAEFEANINPTKQWQTLLGYAFYEAKITNSRDAVQIGARLPNTARHNLSLWNRYDFDNGLGIGLGLVYTGKRAGVLPTNAAPAHLLLPKYTTVDLALYYTRAPYSINLKIGNLFDRRYYESAGLSGATQVQPGAPRNITLSTRLSL